MEPRGTAKTYNSGLVIANSSPRNTLLVTGGAGFIGSHLAVEALRAGDRVVVLDNLATGHRGNVPEGALLLERDVRDTGLEELLVEHGVTAVSHHAAQANVRVSLDDPAFDADVNLVGGLRVLRACERVGIRRFLFASSGGTVYGEQNVFPCDESHATRPASPYGCAKLAFEHYLDAAAQVGTIDPVILRYANVYGPRQDPKGEAGIVAILAQRLLAHDPPKIFGDGDQTRDYVFVGDIARAQRALLDDWKPGIYNVGTGHETSVVELLAKVRRHLANDTPVIHTAPVPGELRRSALDGAKLLATAGLPAWTDLDGGLAATLPFYVDQHARRAAGAK
jgi:UDP-glucose 4-epimerase